MVFTKLSLRLSPWIILIAVINIIIHLAFYNTLGFHRDELLYFSLGQHLAAGYASVPPFTGFLAWIMIHLTGYSLLSAKLIPMILSGFLIILGASITRELNGKLYAQILVAIAIIVAPFNLRGFSLFQPVCFDVFFWSLVFWTSLKWINTKADKYILLLGVIAGIGLLNKYLIALELFGIIVSFLLSPNRHILKRRSVYIALLIALLIFLPNIIWQVKNDFPFLIHLQALHDKQLVHVNRLSFFTDQLFIGSLSFLVFIPGIVFLSFSSEMKPYRPLLFASFLIFIILVILRGKSYYAIGLFPFWIAAGGVIWEKWLKRTFTRILFPFTIILFTWPILPMGLPIYKADKLANYFTEVRNKSGFDMFLRWEDGSVHSLPQDYADMLGWDELAAITSKAYEQVEDKKSVMIYAENYGEAGAVMVIGKKYNLPDPACFAESFFYWIPKNPTNEITSLIYINSELGKDVQEIFAECRVIGKIENPLARECGTGVWLCAKPKRSFNELWNQRVGQISDPFKF
jgi:hypothetical protein